MLKRSSECRAKECIEYWFSELTQFLEATGYFDIFNDSRTILNCDETGCMTCPSTGKVLGPKCFKNLYEISSENQLQFYVLTVQMARSSRSW